MFMGASFALTVAIESSGKVCCCLAIGVGSKWHTAACNVQSKRRAIAGIIPARGCERLHSEAKLRELRQHGVWGFAHVSHACFLVVSKDRGLVERARSLVICESLLPEGRFLPVDPG
jgi:hypothetical protein